jgi:hypothetical protein
MGLHVLVPKEDAAILGGQSLRQVISPLWDWSLGMYFVLDGEMRGCKFALTMTGSTTCTCGRQYMCVCVSTLIDARTYSDDTKLKWISHWTRLVKSIQSGSNRSTLRLPFGFPHYIYAFRTHGSSPSPIHTNLRPYAQAFLRHARIRARYVPS